MQEGPRRTRVVQVVRVQIDEVAVPAGRDPRDHRRGHEGEDEQRDDEARFAPPGFLGVAHDGARRYQRETSWDKARGAAKRHGKPPASRTDRVASAGVGGSGADAMDPRARRGVAGRLWRRQHDGFHVAAEELFLGGDDF